MTAPHAGIDTTATLTPYLPMLAREGVKWASQYLRPGGITKDKAAAILAHKINLILNYEGKGDDINAFSAAKGVQDATYAMGLAKAIGAPVGTAIYFSCEPNNYGNLTSAYNARVLPYWRSVNTVLQGQYRVGAYSFGTWLEWLRRDGASEFFWLPNAKGWPGYAQFLASGWWHYHQLLPSNVNFNGLLVDWDEVNPKMTDIGAWMAPDSPPVPVPVIPPTIRRGSRGEDVKKLQRILSISDDGIFGSMTERAVKFYQAAHGLAADGVVGPRSWSVLLS